MTANHEPQLNITGLHFTMNPDEALTFRYQGTATTLAEEIVRHTGKPAAVITHGPARRPMMQHYTILTGAGEVQHPKFSGEDLTVRRDEVATWNFDAASTIH